MPSLNSTGARLATILLTVLITCWGAQVQATIEIPLDRLGNLSLDAEQEQLEEILAYAKNDPYVVADLGRIAYQRSNFDLARRLWAQASSKEPNIPGPDVQLAFADIASGQLDGAQRRIDELNLPGTTDAHVVIAAAELAMARNDQQQANQLLQRALDMAPKLPAAHLTLGHFQETTGDVASAQASYEKVAELLPDRTHGWLRLGALMFRQRRHGEALAAYQKAEKCHGVQPLAETRMGEAFYLQGDLFAAHRQFTAALERKADDPFPRLRLAQTLARAGRAMEASAQLQQILAAQEYPEAVRLLAEHEMQAGNAKEAIDLYRRALKANPNDWVAANNLSILFVQTGGPADEAVALVDQAAKLAPPTLASLQGTKGCALWHAGRFAEAEPLLAAAIAAVPNYSWTRYCYGQTLHALKRDTEAREQFEACLFLDPAFPKRDEIAKILAALPAN